MRRNVLIIFIFLLAACGCGPRKKVAKSNNDSSEQTVEADKLSKRDTLSVVDDIVLPAGGLFSTDFKYIFFGKIGYDERSFREDTLVYPPINGLIHKSVYVICPDDTCFAERAILALRCPPIQPLLDWVADTVNTFVHECPIGNGLLTYNDKEIDISKKHFKSANAICDYYIGQLRHTYDKWHCTGEGDHDVLNEQAGLLLADCWEAENLYTFYRIDWYDWLSGGNNARESWWTVDSTTGKLLGLSDFILPDKLDTLAALMMPRLINGKDSFILDQYPYKPEEYIGVLQRADGCALISEGLVFYFYPYNIGCGADGEYEAVIPYEKLNGILREPLSTVLVPLSLEENTDPHDYRRKDGRPHIDFFGVDLVGTPKRILHKLNKNPIVQIDLGQEGFLNEVGNKVTCRVLIGGYPFGMNLTFGEGESEIVEEVMLVTSETNWDAMANLTKVLSDYYGQPESVDYYEKRYIWNSRGYTIIARPLHSKDSGWTLLFR